MAVWRFQVLFALLAVVVFSRLNHKNADDAEYDEDSRVSSKSKKSKGRKVAKVSSKKNKYDVEDLEDYDEGTGKKGKSKKDYKLAKTSKKIKYDPEEYEDDDVSEDPSEETFESVTMKQIRDLHKKFDKDGDGKASLEEMLNFADDIHKETLTHAVPDILKALDHIKDGKLSLKEVLDDLEESEAAHHMTQDELATVKELETLKFEVADADKDGKLDLQEVSSLFYPEPHSEVLKVSVREFIKKRDTDGDGKISADEFWTKEDQERLEEDFNYSKTHDVESSKMGKDIFDKLDKDKDGLLDADELMEWESGQFHMKESFQELFDLADKDKDHHLSVKEIEKAKRDIAQIEAQYHLLHWMEHFEL